MKFERSIGEESLTSAAFSEIRELSDAAYVDSYNDGNITNSLADVQVRTNNTEHEEVWMQFSACRGVDTKVFFPGKEIAKIRIAKAICERCIF